MESGFSPNARKAIEIKNCVRTLMFAHSFFDKIVVEQSEKRFLHSTLITLFSDKLHAGNQGSAQVVAGGGALEMEIGKAVRVLPFHGGL